MRERCDVVVCVDFEVVLPESGRQEGVEKGRGELRERQLRVRENGRY